MGKFEDRLSKGYVPDKLEPDYAALAARDEDGPKGSSALWAARLPHQDKFDEAYEAFERAALMDARDEPKEGALWSSFYMPGSFEATFADLYQEAFELLVERQRKYGPNNIRKLGLWGVFGRFADDKVERIRRSFNGTITNGELDVTLDGDFGDEALEDAIIDSGNYPLIMLALLRGIWGRPLEEDMDD